MFFLSGWILTTLIAVTCFLPANQLYANPSEPVLLGAEEWYPYFSAKLKHKGFVARLITAAFESQGVNVEYRFMPWARALHMAQVGNIDGTFLWYKTPEREPMFYFSEKPVATINAVFFHLKQRDFKWQSLDDLTNYRIGATIGYHISEEFDQYAKAKRIQVQRIASDTQILKMLLHDRVDLFPQDLLVGYGQIFQTFPAPVARLFIHHPKPLTSRPAYLLLSRKKTYNQRLIKQFNLGLARLYDNGQYKQFFDEMIGENPTRQ